MIKGISISGITGSFYIQPQLVSEVGVYNLTMAERAFKNYNNVIVYCVDANNNILGAARNLKEAEKLFNSETWK